MNSNSVTARLTPQMADYDRLSARVDWRPYLMFFQQPNFVSATVTTDRYGFRPTIDPYGRALALDDVAQRSVSLLIGNSVSFGVGATADRNALSSRLANYSGECWVNFCGRAFGAMQELILFQAYRHKLGSVRRVVLCSGLNDLYLFYAPKLFDETFGIFFFSEAFHRSMNAAQATLSNKRALLAALLRPFYGDRIDYGSVRLAELPRLLLRPPAAPLDPDAVDYTALVGRRRPQRQRIIEQMARPLELWAAMARGLNFELVYALQPMLPWLGKTLSSEERELLDAQDAEGGRWHRILRAVLDDDHHAWYTAALSSLCGRLGIRFVDMNPALRQDGRWLFVDRVHMNDVGQDMLAQALVRALAPEPQRATS
jgi:hypothetical protein